MSKQIGLSFATEAMRAMLDGRKTQTRRVIAPSNSLWDHKACAWFDISGNVIDHITSRIQCGDLLYWANEPIRISATWVVDENKVAIYSCFDRTSRTVKIPDRIKPPKVGRWLGRHLPPEWARPDRWLVKSVRPERLQEITPTDCTDEGCPESLGGEYAVDGLHSNVVWFSKSWDRVNIKRGYPWSQNDWVWVFEFEKVEA